MDNQDYKEVAKAIVAKIKDTLLTSKKKQGINNPCVEIHAYRCSFGFRPSQNYYDYFKLSCGAEYGEFKDDYKVRCCWREIINGLKELKQTRGFSTLVFETREIGNYPTYWDVVDKVTLLDAPCKEFTQLKNYIKKYGNFDLKDEAAYSVNMFGKRGQLDQESGKRNYLCHNPQRCAEYLIALRKVRGTNDKMSCRFVTDEYMDENERRASEYYERECYGEKTAYLEVTIKTPSGKTKLSRRIY